MIFFDFSILQKISKVSPLLKFGVLLEICTKRGQMHQILSFVWYGLHFYVTYICARSLHNCEPFLEHSCYYRGCAIAWPPPDSDLRICRYGVVLFFLNSQMLSLYTFSSSIKSLSRSVNKNLDLGGPGVEAPRKIFWDFRHMFDDFKHKI